MSAEENVVKVGSFSTVGNDIGESLSLFSSSFSASSVAFACGASAAFSSRSFLRSILFLAPALSDDVITMRSMKRMTSRIRIRKTKAGRPESRSIMKAGSFSPLMNLAATATDA